METLKKYLMAFLRFANLAAPVAASVATISGHDDVVGDINKAGEAAKAAEGIASAIDAAAK